MKVCFFDHFLAFALELAHVACGNDVEILSLLLLFIANL